MQVMQLIMCDDETCRHNVDGFCRCDFLEVKVGRDYGYKSVNICASYEDKNDGTD